MKRSKIKEFLSASYNNNVNNVGSYIKDTSLSTEESKVFYDPETGKAVVAHRGTELLDPNDWYNNAVYALAGTTGYKITLQKSKRCSKKAEKKYGAKNFTTLG